MSRRQNITYIILSLVLFVLTSIFYILDVSKKVTFDTVLLFYGLILISLFINLLYVVFKDSDKMTNLIRKLSDWLSFLSISVLSILFVISFFVSTSKVDGSSMNPTLEDKNLLVVYHFNYQPKKNDIVIIKDNGIYLVKRVIAKGFDVIDIKSYDSNNYAVYLNNETKPVEDGFGNVYKIDKARTVLDEGSYKLSKNELFILGDNGKNFNSSSDSKQNSFYHKSNVIGKVVWNVNG